MRVFMCTAGVSGERMCATRLMPAAQKRGSSARPGISLRAVSARCACAPSAPWTVETLTPTFSKTRPSRITAMTPPPASSSPSPARRVSLRANRPAGRSAKGPVSCASSSASKAAQMSSRSAANQALARALCVSVTSIEPMAVSG